MATTPKTNATPTTSLDDTRKLFTPPTADPNAVDFSEVARAIAKKPTQMQPSVTPGAPSKAPGTDTFTRFGLATIGQAKR